MRVSHKPEVLYFVMRVFPGPVALPLDAGVPLLFGLRLPRLSGPATAAGICLLNKYNTILRPWSTYDENLFTLIL
jgi:hypothetical protein